MDDYEPEPEDHDGPPSYLSVGPLKDAATHEEKPGEQVVKGSSL